MKVGTIILLFFFSLGILSRTNLFSLKKIKSPIELASSEDFDESSDLDESEKTADEKEELDKKNAHYVNYNAAFIFLKDIRYTKHFLDHHKQLFKSHFKEVVCPPPEFTA